MQNPDGTAVWFELLAPDADAAQDFHAAVMGWRVAPSGMEGPFDYRIATAPDGAAIAGLMATPEGGPGGGRSGWTLYFGVGDVDRAVGKVTALGGSVAMGPMDLPGVGRFALVADPQGIPFYVMRGDGDDSSTAFLPGPGNIGHGVWNELSTPDPDAAFAFYGPLFGWEKAGAMPMGEMGEYAFIGAGETRPGAIMSSETTGAPPRWNAYFHVADIDAAIATVKAKGGTVLQGPDQIPGGDYSANIADPHGSAVGIVGPRIGAAG